MRQILRIKRTKKMQTLSRIFVALLLAASFGVAADPFADGNNNANGKAFQDEDGSVFSSEDFDEGEMSENGHTSKMMFLDSVQKHFWNPKRKLQDNNYNILHRDGDTHMIRTRYAMTTTIIFDNDPIAKVIFGDPNGFELTELGAYKWDLRNVLTIKPKLIGIDTNLTIIGESGTIYTFYIFSTHFTNRRDPAFTVFVSKDRKIGKITMKDLESEEYKKSKKKGDDSYKRIEYDAIEEDDGEFITIGDNVNKIHIEKAKIKRGYASKPKAKRNWKTLWLTKKESPDSVKMQPIDIFNDNEYTYFKFDREDAMSKFPVVFKVVDGYDNPVNVKIVGNYIIAEDLSEKWTLKMGEEYVCIKMIQKPMVIKQKVEDSEDKDEEDEEPKESKDKAPAKADSKDKKPKVESKKKKPNQNTIDSRDRDELIKRNQERIKELEKLQKESKAQADVMNPKAQEGNTAAKSANKAAEPKKAQPPKVEKSNFDVYVPKLKRRMPIEEFEKLKAAGKVWL